MAIRHYKKLLLVLLVGVFLASLTALMLRQQPPLRIASHVWPGYELLFLGQNLGFLPDDQVNLHATNSATESLQLLSEGKVDGAALTLDETLKAIDQGLGLTVILVFDISVGADQIIARSEIETFDQLKGKSVAVEDSAVGALMLAMALKQHGMNQEDLRLHTITIDQHLGAWSSGSYDAIVTYEPTATILHDQGGQAVFDSTQIPNTIIDVLVISNDVMDTQYGHIRTLVKAYYRSQEHFLTNIQDASFRMSGRLGVPSNSVASLYKGMQLPTAEQSHQLLAHNNRQLQELAVRLRDLKLWTRENARPPRKLRHTNQFIELDQ